MKRRRPIENRVRVISGSVTLKKLCRGVAPSTLAASIGSVGREESPARHTITTIGVICQVSTAAIAGITVSFADTKEDLGSPTEVNIKFIRPEDGS